MTLYYVIKLLDEILVESCGVHHGPHRYILQLSHRHNFKVCPLLEGPCYLRTPDSQIQLEMR